MDWIFILQFFLVLIIWLGAKYFYRHSDWLHSNKPIKIPIRRFPRLITFLEKLLNKNDIFLYVVITPISLATILGGILLAAFLCKGAFKEFESLLYSQTWWMQVLIWACIILCFFGIKIWKDGKREKSFLSSKKEDASRYSTKNVPQKVSEVDAVRIPTYPRITICDMSGNAKDHHIIFDSSDFSVISRAFGLFDGLNYTSILNAENLKFKEIEYLVIKVRVDLLDFFDDYSINPLGGRHTKVYEGRDVPYNIQIIVEAIPKES